MMLKLKSECAVIDGGFGIKILVSNDVPEGRALMIDSYRVVPGKDGLEIEIIGKAVSVKLKGENNA